MNAAELLEQLLRQFDREDRSAAPGLIQALSDIGQPLLGTIMIVRNHYAIDLGTARAMVTAHPAWEALARATLLTEEDLVAALDLLQAGADDVPST